MRPKPLAGIRILDLSRLMPGPLCSRHLADLGADVVKVEDPGPGDYARAMSFADHANAPGNFYACLNRNKRSLRVDLRRAEGRALFLDLADTADAIIEGFRPGVVQRLGIDYEAVRARNPRLVYCSISGYGQTGPYRDQAGHDINYCALTGVLDQQGAAGGPPAPGNFQIADLAGGALCAAMALLAGLLDARRNGVGRYLDVAMSDCTLAHAIAPLAALNDRGTDAERGAGMLSGGLARYGVYATADGRYMALGALEDKFWRRFCAAVDRPAFAERHDEAALREEIAEIFRAKTQSQWVAELGDKDCCATPVLTLSEAARDPHNRARQMFQALPGDNGLQTAFPVKISDYEFSVDRPPPAHGEHGADLLAELGYDPARISALRESGVI